MQWAPPVMDISDQEMMWLEEDESAVCLLWDSNTRLESSHYIQYIHSYSLLLSSCFLFFRSFDLHGSKIESSQEQMMELMASALVTPLNPKQQQQLAAKIRDDPNFILQFNITPNNVCPYTYYLIMFEVNCVYYRQRTILYHSLILYILLIKCDINFKMLLIICVRFRNWWKITLLLQWFA